MPDARASRLGSGDRDRRNVHRGRPDAGLARPDAGLARRDAGLAHLGEAHRDAVFPGEVRPDVALPDAVRRDVEPQEERDERRPVAARPDEVPVPGSRRTGCFRPTADAAPVLGLPLAPRAAAYRSPLRARVQLRRVQAHPTPVPEPRRLPVAVPPELASRLAVEPAAGQG